MEFKLKEENIQKLSTFKLYRSVSSYLMTNNFDLDEGDNTFAIYDTDNSPIGFFEIAIAPEKPVINIQRMKVKPKDLQTQEEVLKNFIDYLWDYHNTNHLILKIDVYSPGSGMSPYLLTHLGFCDNGYKNEYFSLLNPLYPDFVEAFSETRRIKKGLMEYYNQYQTSTKKNMQERLENGLSLFLPFVDDTTLSLEERARYQQEVLHYTESLHNLNATATPQQKEMIFKKTR